MKVTLKYGGNVVELPDAAAVSMVQQGHATALREDIEPVAIAAAAEVQRRRAKIAAELEETRTAALDAALAVRANRLAADAQETSGEPPTPQADIAPVTTPASLGELLSHQDSSK